MNIPENTPPLAPDEKVRVQEDRTATLPPQSPQVMTTPPNGDDTINAGTGITAGTGKIPKAVWWVVGLGVLYFVGKKTKMVLTIKIK